MQIPKNLKCIRSLVGLSNTQLGSQKIEEEKKYKKIQRDSTVNIICMVTPTNSEFEDIADNYKHRLLSEKSKTAFTSEKSTLFTTITYSSMADIDHQFTTCVTLIRWFMLRNNNIFVNLSVIYFAHGHQYNNCFGDINNPMINRDKFLDIIFKNK